MVFTGLRFVSKVVKDFDDTYVTRLIAACV